MKTIAIVAEYNPFHLGHGYQIKQLKSEDSYIISIMSGSFVQRGEPALIDKYRRAKSAVLSGVDLVIELPSVFSLQSAEVFAKASVGILNLTNSVDYLAFGSEIGDLDYLLKIRDLVNEEYYKSQLINYINLGYSYPVANSKALEMITEKYDIPYIQLKSNDILALEYLKNISGTKISPISIKRMGSSYLSEDIIQDFSSATAIRNYILNKGMDSHISESLTQSSIELIKEFNSSGLKYGNIESVLDYLKFSAYVSKNNFDHISVYESGLENLILNNLYKSESIYNFLEKTSSKRYKKSRLKRFLINYILGIKNQDFESLIKNSYIRPLAFNEKGIDILGEIKKKSSLPIISKFSEYYNSHQDDYLLNKELQATNLFNLLINSDRFNEDFYISPNYIKTANQ
ncbi:MAG: nucleotidyltransferase family protein [Tissierellia bacterium]|nr:nucleotidyltransferase family protein [Tissierellia bacterium]